MRTSGMRLWMVLAVCVAVCPMMVAAQEPGTLGFALAQLYSNEQPNRRGVLIVRRVDKGSAAADAGIEAGDIIVSVNGTDTAGHDAAELRHAGLAGPVGESVKLKVAKMNRPPAEMVLMLKPYPPHVNLATDAFQYSIPGDWQMDPRYPFPLPWASSIAYKGFEDLAFAPGFDDSSSPEYHSYLILWWLNDAPTLTAESLDKDMVTYFRGLAEQRGRNNKFTPDLTKVAASYREGAGLQSFGGAVAKNFAGTVTLYDRHGEVITLHSEVVTAPCVAAGHTAVFFSMSKEPRPAALWKRLDAVRDGFRCKR